MDIHLATEQEQPEMMTAPQRLLRAVLTGAIVSIVWTVTSYASPSQPTRGELLQTLQHIDALVMDQQTQLAREKSANLAVAAALGRATRDNTSLQSRINALTEKLNSTQDKLDKAAKALWWYRLHWWGAWIVLGLAAGAWVLWAALKVAGKLPL